MIAAKFREAWRGLIVAVVPCITTSLPFPWVCTSHTFLVWLILWPTRTLSRLFSPALLPRICIITTFNDKVTCSLTEVYTAFWIDVATLHTTSDFTVGFILNLYNIMLICVFILLVP